MPVVRFPLGLLKYIIAQSGCNSAEYVSKGHIRLRAVFQILDTHQTLLSLLQTTHVK